MRLPAPPLRALFVTRARGCPWEPAFLPYLNKPRKIGKTGTLLVCGMRDEERRPLLIGRVMLGKEVALQSIGCHFYSTL